MRSPLHHNRNPDSDSNSDSDSDTSSISESDTSNITSRGFNKDQATDNIKARMSSDESTTNKEMDNQNQNTKTATETGQHPHVSTQRTGAISNISIQNIESGKDPKQSVPEKSANESIVEAKAEFELIQVRIELERKKIELTQLTQNGPMAMANPDNLKTAKSVIHTRMPKNIQIQRSKRNATKNDEEEEKWCENFQRSTHSTEDC